MGKDVWVPNALAVPDLQLEESAAERGLQTT